MAVELARLRRERGGRENRGSGNSAGMKPAKGRGRVPGGEGEEEGRSLRRREKRAGERKGQVVVVGASILDFTARMTSQHIMVSMNGALHFHHQISWAIDAQLDVVIKP